VVEPGSWLLSHAERDNPHTTIDERYGDGRAWSSGNVAEPLVDGAVYFAALHEAIEATREGDLVFFTDWQGDGSERLTGDAGSEVVEVLASARERGVDVRGLVWRSHGDQVGFFAAANRHLGEQLHRRGVAVMLDMRVRPGGSHHQKFVVIRHADDPARDVAFIGGIDLARNRRDDHTHAGDPQGRELTPEYGAHAPWHDVQVRLRGPVVHDVETVFRERWADPSALSRAPWRRAIDAVRRVDTTPAPLRPQAPAPPEVGHHTVQLLLTYPDLGWGRSYPFAPRGERSVARGYRKAIGNAESLVYVEDQYFWGHGVAEIFGAQLRRNPGLRLMVVIPLYPDVVGLNRSAQTLGRHQAIDTLQEIAPGRVAAYGLENRESRPVYVHAKVSIIDDQWASTGSDNFNRRSWTHDSELTAAVLDADYARGLRLRLAAEHLGRLDLLDDDHGDLAEVMADCVDPHAMFDRYAEQAEALEAWHRGGRRGPRPDGRLRHLPPFDLSRLRRPVATVLLDRVHNPDGRPRELRDTTLL